MPSRAIRPDLKSRMRINNQIVPEDIPVEEPIRTVPQEGVVDAFYPFPNKPHGHHLQSADEDVDMAVWSWNEQSRQLQQEDRNHDETIKPNGKR